MLKKNENRGIALRLIELRNERNYTLKQIEHLTGISSTSLSYYENGERTPIIENLVALADFFNVNLEWLTTGNGTKYRLKIEDLPGFLTDQFRRIPILARISAGIPSEVLEDDIIGWDLVPDIPKYRDVHSGILVHGDSMTPTLEDGDVVWIVQNFDITTLPTKKIVVVRVENDCAIRRFQRSSAGIYFTADNPNYPPLVSPPQKIELLALAHSISRML